MKKFGTPVGGAVGRAKEKPGGVAVTDALVEVLGAGAWVVEVCVLVLLGVPPPPLPFLAFFGLLCWFGFFGWRCFFGFALRVEVVLVVVVRVGVRRRVVVVLELGVEVEVVVVVDVVLPVVVVVVVEGGVQDSVIEATGSGTGRCRAETGVPGATLTV